MQMTFGDAMRFRRDQLGYSQEELAELVGRDQSTIARWERQNKPPKDPFVLTQLAEALQMDVEALRAGRLQVSGPLVSLDEARTRTLDELIKQVARLRAPDVDPREAEGLLRALLRLDMEGLRLLGAQAEYLLKLKKEREESPRTNHANEA